MDPETKLQVQNAKHEVVAITEMLNRFVDNLSQSPYSLSLSFYTPIAHDTSVVYVVCTSLSLHFSTFSLFLPDIHGNIPMYMYMNLFSLVTTCFDKCVTHYSSGEPSTAENACLDRCVIKYIQAQTAVKSYTYRINSHKVHS